jgi:hypothetical protein
MSTINAAILWDPSTSAVPMDSTTKQTSTGMPTVSQTESLNPVNNQDFVAQLATFSSLEQLIDINKAVSKLAGGPDQQTSDGTNGTSVS